MIREAGLTLGLQTMTGLPGADEESDLLTARRIAALEPAFVRIYPTVVIRQTPLAEAFARGEYRPRSLEETVALCSKLSRIYRKFSIPVIRMGLQTTETVSLSGDGSEVVGGPYHEAFGQLVRSFDALETVTEALRLSEERLGAPDNPGWLILVAPEKNFSDVLGQKRRNAGILRERFGFRDVSVRAGTGRGNYSENSCVFSGDCGSFSEDKERFCLVTELTREIRRVPRGPETTESFTDVTVKLLFRE